MESGTSIAVWGDRVLRGTSHNDGVKTYECPTSPTTVHVYTDSDVAVNVFFEYTKTSGTTEAFQRTYPVYPVDTYDTEFQAEGNGRTLCFPVSIYDNVTATVYLERFFAWKNGNSSDRLYAGDKFNIKNAYTETNIITTRGLVFHFDKPSTVFCQEKSKPYNFFHQLSPLSSWSETYIIPTVFTSFHNDTKTLIIHPSVDNVQVNISGVSESVLTLSLGETEEMPIVVDSKYTIKASSPISVAIVHGAYYSFVPPLPSFIPNGVFTSVPLRAMQNIFNISKLVSLSVDNDGNASNLTRSTLNSQEDFYVSWNVNGDKPSYGFTVLYNGEGKWFLAPGYTLSGRLRVVSFFLILSQAVLRLTDLSHVVDCSHPDITVTNSLYYTH